MAKTQSFLAELFSRLGKGAFRILSKWEECRFLPGAARWLKLSVLGIVASLVVSFSLKAEEPTVLCYIAARMPQVSITDVSVSPNPTKGADSVTVKAFAKVLDPSLKNNYINAAWLTSQSDTTKIPVRALDGKLDDTLEVLEGRFYVGGLQLGDNWLSLVVTTSEGAIESTWPMFVVSEPDTLPADSTGTGE